MLSWKFEEELREMSEKFFDSVLCMFHNTYSLTVSSIVMETMESPLLSLQTEISISLQDFAKSNILIEFPIFKWINFESLARKFSGMKIWKWSKYTHN